MSIDLSKVDLLLQYTLLMAGEEEDYTERQLGPIHLIKYVYLADLAFARRNGGTTFTNAPWEFYKFGPWSQSVNARIEPALSAIGAEKKSFPSNYGDKEEWVRWFITDDYLAEKKERELPPVITMCLKREIHKYGKDTVGLLDYVYTTKPMLSAAPKELLDFSVAAEDAYQRSTTGQPLRSAQLSAKMQKTLKSKMLDLQKTHQSRETNKIRLINPVKNPRFDDVFKEGVEWLNKLAGEQLQLGEFVAEFSPEVWKSPTRKGGDVS